MISPLTNEKKFGDVSTEDFTTLGVTVVQNSSDITTANTQIAANAAKPSSSQVDSQIDAKNTTQMTQLYTKTETDAALALKGSASGLATVTAYASGLPTTTTVNNLIDSKNITQDITNFGTFAVRSDTYTKSAVDTIVSNQAATTASTYAPQSSTYTKTQVDAIETNINTTAASTYATQSALATVSTSAATNATNITATGVEVILLQSAVTANSAQGNTSATTLAGVVAGSQALASADITGNAIVGGSLQAAGITSTGSFLGASWAAFGSIPLNPQTGVVYAQQLSTTGNVTCAGSLFVGGVQVTGGAAAATAGDVLKVTRTCFNPHNNVLVPTGGSWVTAITFTHTPSDSQSHLNLTFTAIWKIFTANSGDDGEWLIQIEVDGSAVGGTLLRTIGTSETGSSSPCIGQYTNSSLTAKVITVRARQTGSANDQLMFNNAGVDSTWLHIEEVKR